MTNDKILQLELKKVRYIRKLSFLQGTTINALRTSILALMLYLIFVQQNLFGEFFSLWIYSFFIFGPLQELGNIINTYREAEASLINFKTILSTPVEAQPEHPVTLGPVRVLDFKNVSFQHLTATTKALSNITSRHIAAKRSRLSDHQESGKTTLVKLLVGLYHPKEGDITYNSHTA